jgi:hypothetical protein
MLERVNQRKEVFVHKEFVLESRVVEVEASRKETLREPRLWRFQLHIECKDIVQAHNTIWNDASRLLPPELLWTRKVT